MRPGAMLFLACAVAVPAWTASAETFGHTLHLAGVGPGHARVALDESVRTSAVEARVAGDATLAMVWSGPAEKLYVHEPPGRWTSPMPFPWSWPPGAYDVYVAAGDGVAWSLDVANNATDASLELAPWGSALQALKPGVVNPMPVGGQELAVTRGASELRGPGAVVVFDHAAVPIVVGAFVEASVFHAQQALLQAQCAPDELSYGGAPAGLEAWQWAFFPAGPGAWQAGTEHAVTAWEPAYTALAAWLPMAPDDANLGAPAFFGQLYDEHLAALVPQDPYQAAASAACTMAPLPGQP